MEFVSGLSYLPHAFMIFIVKKDIGKEISTKVVRFCEQAVEGKFICAFTCFSIKFNLYIQRISLYFPLSIAI